MRKKILDISYAELERMGFSKGTLNYIMRNTKADMPFKIYGKLREKLDGVMLCKE